MKPGCVENGCTGEGTIIVKCGGGGLLWCDEHRASAEAAAARIENGKVQKFRP